MRTSLGMARLAFGAVLTAGSTLALACGFCVEDRIATVYDHAMVEAATASKNEVAFFSLDGVTHDAARRALTAALASAGATKGSVRISDGACSAAYDPARTSAAKIAASVNTMLAARGMTLVPLRVIEARGKS